MSRLHPTVVSDSSPARTGLGASTTAFIRSCVLVGADLGAFAVAVVLAFLLDVAVVSPPLERAYYQIMHSGAFWHGWGTLLVLVVLITYFGGHGHYTRRIPFWSEVGTVIGGTAMALVCDGFITLAIYHYAFGYEGMLRWVLFVPSVLILRLSMRSALDLCGLWALRTLIIGETQAVECAKLALESQPRLGYRVVQTVECRPDDIAAWAERLRPDDVDFVIVGLGQPGAPSYRPLIAALMRARVQFALVPTFDGLPVLGFRNQYFFSHEIMFLVGRNNLARPVSRLMKLIFDQTIAVLLLVILAPVLLTISLLILLEGRPIFFSHSRVGANGALFRCLKFRTMVADADHILSDLLQSDPIARAEWAATRKLQNDPRITRIGRFLRKTSLDELPQLINVLQGHMSLVGPRPISEQEIALYGEDIGYYYDIRPGMTGLWQVSGRSRASYARRVQLVVWYIKNWTLWHDITILLKTIPAVLRRDGAV